MTHKRWDATALHNVFLKLTTTKIVKSYSKTWSNIEREREEIGEETGRAEWGEHYQMLVLH